MMPNSYCGRSRQQGVALVVVLMLLLVMTLLALASVRGALMEERMTANQLDRSLAFQAAEAALREGEDDAKAKPAFPAAGVCNNGLCGVPDPEAAPVWLDETVWATAPEAVIAVGDITAAPKYIIELLATDIPAVGECTTTGDVSESECSGSESRYRITARSVADGRAEVILQSNFAVP